MKEQGHGATEEGLIPDRESAREFISIAVHDLREPLRAIRASSEMLAGRADSADESTARCVRYVQDGVDRMELLIHDIAEYCYEEIRELQSEEMDIEGVLLEAQKLLSGELKRNEATLTHGPLPVLKGDSLGLTAVFRVLIANACKFRGEANPRIDVEAVKQGSEWVLSVRDNGLGFDPAYQDLIFKPFERLNGRQYPGSGLGLALAKRIVQRHGGRIWAESKPGEGSVFRFSLPD